MSDYSLFMFPNILGLSGGTGTIQNLTSRARDWKRSTRANGGFWLGSFVLDGTDSEKLDAFYGWLGSHVEERSGGGVTWEGMVYEMDLNYYGVRRKVSLDDMFNAVSTTYTEMAYGGDNMFENPDFELGNLSGWVDVGGDIEGSIVYDGSYSARVTSGATVQDGHDPNGYLRQNVNTSAGGVYQVSIWCRGDTGHARVGIRDPNDSDWIFKPRDISKSDTWVQAMFAPVFGPADGEILFYCYSTAKNAGQYAYFDNAECLEWGPSVFETDEYWVGKDAPDNLTVPQSPPIAAWGKKELKLTSDNLPKDAADAYAESQLRLSHDPWPRALSIGQATTAELRVYVAGYVHTANWMYVEEGDNSEDNMYTWLGEIVGTTTGISPLHGGTDAGAGDCQYLSANRIALNSTQVNKKPSLDSRAWDVIMENVVLGDSSQNIYRAYVTTGRRFNMDVVSFTPTYYIKGGKIYDGVAETTPVNPWSVQPAVFRDMDYTVSQEPYDSPFQDIRDTWVDEIVVHSDGRIVPKTSMLSEADVWAAQAQALEFEIEDPMDRESYDPTIWRP
jgi:hypothetical protein